MATLAELRAQKGSRKTLPTWVRRITLDQSLLADLQRLDLRRAELEVEAERIAKAEAAKARKAAEDDPDAAKRTRKAGQRARPQRLVEIDAELAALDEEVVPLYEKIRETEGELLGRGIPGGEWQRWKDEHPPRKIGQRETRRENGEVAETLTGGPIYHPDDQLMTEWGAIPVCNAADLREDLARYMVAWNGEGFAEGDWDGWFADQIAPGDFRDIVRDVMEAHEKSGIRAPKAPSSPATNPESDG